MLRLAVTIAAVLLGALASPAFASAQSVSITSPADGSFINDAQPTVRGTSESIVDVCISIRQGEGPWAQDGDCEMPEVPSGDWSHPLGSPLADGAHQVRVADTLNTASDTRTFTVDTQLPTVAIQSGPDGLTNDPTPTFQFSASEPVTSLECAVDSAAFSGCASPYTTQHLADGAHAFQVKATDRAQNVGPATTRSFTVDTTPPAVAVTSGPSGSTTDTTPTFGFAVEAGAAKACRFDAAPFGPCSGDSSHTPASPLAGGSHVFEVWAKDAAGNSAMATRGFTIAILPSQADPAHPADPAAPETMITKGRKRVRKRRVKIHFASTEPGSTFLCKLDKRPFFPCTSPKKYKRLKPGKHRFFVSAKGPAGAIDFSPAKHKFKVVKKRAGKRKKRR